MRWVILALIALPVVGVIGFCAWAEHTIRQASRSPYQPPYFHGEE